MHGPFRSSSVACSFCCHEITRMEGTRGIALNLEWKNVGIVLQKNGKTLLKTSMASPAKASYSACRPVLVALYHPINKSIKSFIQ
jgi:hypothetical protein